jgi:putative ABC transport system substrate-binding protein
MALIAQIAVGVIIGGLRHTMSHKPKNAFVVVAELVPTAHRVAVLVNPNNTSATETTLHDVQDAAPVLGLQVRILNATTIAEINAAFAALAQDRPDALFVAPDGFLNSRAVQFAILSARERIPASYSNRETVAVGGLMSYGTDLAEVFSKVGVYTAKILKGEKPTELPVSRAGLSASGYAQPGQCEKTV